jgi:hypothetical protein
MPSREEQQLSNLAFFVQDRWNQVFDSDRDHHVQRSESYRNLAVLEAFLWLHSGVECEYFHSVNARRLTYEYFPTLLKAHEGTLISKLDQRFSPPLQAILESQFSGRLDLFSADSAKRPSSLEFRFFQRALILADGFCQESSAQALVDTLAFNRFAQWNAYVDEVRAFVIRNIDRVTMPDKIEMPDQVEALISGFTNIIRYMETFHAFLQEPLPEGEGYSERLPNLKQRIKELQRWRLDFGDDGKVNAFNAMLQAIVEVPQNELPAASLFGRVRELMIDWGAPPMSREAGAS